MTVPPRTLLTLTSLICAAVVTTSRAADAQPAPLPADPAAMSGAFPSTTLVVDGLEASRWTARGCLVTQGVPSCRCLRNGSDAAFDHWTPGDISGVAVVQAGEFDAFAVSSGIWVDGVWVLRDVDMLFRDALLHADEVHLDGASTTFVGLTWFERAGDFEVACAARPERGGLRATAKRAVFERGQWRLSGYRVGPWPVPLARSAHRTAPGFLPPLARATDGSAEIEGSALVLSSLFGFAAAGIDAPVSLGVGWISRRNESTRTLRAMASVESDGVAPVAVGDIAVGGGTHLRGHVEHPSTAQSWALRRAEAGGFFRDWRASHIGAAASGGAHALQLSLTVITDPALPDPQMAGLLTYGTSFEAGRFAHWSVDVEHLTVRDETTRHSTTTGLGLRIPLGWTERAWLRPGADVLANYGAVTVARGFDASTTLSALASVEAGLAIEGRHGSVRHRIAPILRTGAELGGVQQRQEREGAPPYPFIRPDRWRWGVAVLEQSLQHRGIRFEAPIGMFVDAIADGSVQTGAFVRTSAVMGGAQVHLAAACLDACEQVGVLAAASVRPRRRLRLGYSVSDLGTRQGALLFADQLTERGFTAIRLIGDDVPATGFTQIGSIRAERGPAHASIEARVGTSPDTSGLGASLAWRWPGMGWGLGISGAWAPASADWAASAGLSLAP